MTTEKNGAPTAAIRPERFRFLELRFLGEAVLVGAAERADEIGGEVFPFGAGGDAVVGIAGGLVVDPAADVADVFLHDSVSFRFMA